MGTNKQGLFDSRRIEYISILLGLIRKFKISAPFIINSILNILPVLWLQKLRSINFSRIAKNGSGRCEYYHVAALYHNRRENAFNPRRSLDARRMHFLGKTCSGGGAWY